MRRAVSVVTALVTGFPTGVWYGVGASISRARAPGPGLCVEGSNRRGVVTRARSRSRSMKVSSRSRFKLVREGIGACSIGGSKIVGFVVGRPRVPKSDGVPAAPYDRRTAAYPGDTAPAALLAPPMTPGVVAAAAVGRSQAGAERASKAVARSNGDVGSAFANGLAPPNATPTAALCRAARSLSI